MNEQSSPYLERVSKCCRMPVAVVSSPGDYDIHCRGLALRVIDFYICLRCHEVCEVQLANQVTRLDEAAVAGDESD